MRSRAGEIQMLLDFDTNMQGRQDCMEEFKKSIGSTNNASKTMPSREPASQGPV
ncbi:hypothetical protein QIS74_12765 [Colletotrichum tabaci]|uniref:Uncharacterized protein n=1 Tax=Colletotrichum tabaci TaxID=1209068 RepID=A0AAV9SUR5_9PEZI